MDLNLANISDFRQGLNLTFKNALKAAEAPSYPFASVRKSNDRIEKHVIRGATADMRLWEGQRDSEGSSVYTFMQENFKFEKTETVLLEDLEDDRFGIYTDQAAHLGWAAGRWPAVQVYAALRTQGETHIAYDGVPFFATGTRDYDNVSSGSSNAIYFFDTKKIAQAMIWQMRVAPQMQMITKLDDEYVFDNDAFKYGIRARGSAGFGMPQYAYKHKAATLSASDWESIRLAAADIRNDKNQVLGIGYDLCVYGPSRRDEVEKLFGLPMVSDGTGAAAGGNVAVNNRHYNAVKTLMVPSDFLP